MTAPWVPPRPTYYLRVFIVCMLLVVLCLAGFLFGVRLEAVVPATGTIRASDQCDLRAPLTGLVEPGWFEGEITSPGGAPLRVRLDANGDGGTDPGPGPAVSVRAHRFLDGRRVSRSVLRFHRLRPGDELWPGQVLARMWTDEWFPRRSVVRVPDTHARWLALEVAASPGRRLKAGERIALVAPIDPTTGRPLGLVAHLEIHEKHSGEVAPGHTVRIYSKALNRRNPEPIRATIEGLEPWGKRGADGERHFSARAIITDPPQPLPLGSTCKAEIVVGRKQMYRIILEH